MVTLKLFAEGIDSRTEAIKTASRQLAIRFADENEIPSKYKNTKRKKKKIIEDSQIQKRFDKKIENWKETIVKILEQKGEAVGWRFIRVDPNVEEELETVVDCKDFNVFLDYLIQRRDIDNCSDIELGNLAMLHTAFQNKIEQEIGRKLPDFVAIDFEHATADKGSVCSVGLVTVKDGVFVDEYYSLIKPPNNEYGKYQSKTHELTAKDTENAPDFKEIYPEIEKRIKGNKVVAHGAFHTDKHCLEQAMEYYGIQKDLNIVWECTQDICEAKLDVVCDVCSIPLKNHHHALDDTKACARVYLMHINSSLPLDEIKEANTRAKEKSKKIIEIHKPIAKELLQPDFENADRESPFYMKKVVITGTFENWEDRDDLGIKLKELGADINGSISKKTNFVICGKKAGPAKMKKIEELQALGHEIKVINEKELQQLLNDFKASKQ